MRILKNRFIELKDLKFRECHDNELFSHKTEYLFNASTSYDYLFIIRKFKDEDIYNAELYTRDFSFNTKKVQPNLWEDKLTDRDINLIMRFLQNGYIQTIKN